MNKGFCEISIDKLVKADWNYKENNKELAEKLANNIKRNGQIENIIVRELDTGFYEVVNGNHRLDVLKKLGFETVYSFNLGVISEAQAKRIAVETNETKFSSNTESLSALVKELSIEFDDIDLTMPFSEEEMNEMLTEVDIESENENKSSIEDSDIIGETSYSILIELSSEDEARELNDEMNKRGLTCKILIS